MMELIGQVFNTAFISFWHFCGVVIFLVALCNGLTDIIKAFGRVLYYLVMGLRGVKIDRKMVKIKEEDERK